MVDPDTAASLYFIINTAQKENAEVVKAEIQNIQGKYGRCKQEPKLPDFPCPFTASLLGLAWTMDKGEERRGWPYVSGVSFTWVKMPADSRPWAPDCDNNDGITVIDVTDPGSPAYCFMSGEGSMRPITARGYMLYYDDIGDVPAHTLRAFDCIPLVTQDIIDEAWPPQDKLEGAETGPSTDGDNFPRDTANSLISSLAELSLGLALDQAISIGDTSDIERLLLQPQKVDLVRSHLQRHKPFPNSALSLLEAVLADEHDSEAVNLSGFNLSGKQLLQVLSSHNEAVRTLNISFNEVITSEGMSKLLAAMPCLRRLVLIGCTSIMDDDLCDLMRTEPELFYTLDTLLHPMLLEIKEPPQWPVAFTFAGSFDMPGEMRGCCLPVFTPTSVVQSLLDFHDMAMAFLQLSDLKSASRGGMTAQAAFTAVREPDVRWSRRALAAAPLFGVDEWNMPPNWVCIFHYGDCELPAATAFQYAFVKHNRASHSPDGKAVKASVQYFDLPGFLTMLKRERRPPVDKVLAAQLSRRLLSKEES
ncbi:hypothetical protein EVJ58_g4766 [Rhodofomes roseus]|uniref:Uncharacterized protein n=1 Tax=Rhodofomes roseus TaxID=34475 RepID=A0A4Y9YFQ2_9APHY|nr:hypothetical protein EVJ58_g4766 [Rhodofomes roseus]